MRWQLGTWRCVQAVSYQTLGPSRKHFGVRLFSRHYSLVSLRSKVKLTNPTSQVVAVQVSQSKRLRVIVAEHEALAMVRESGTAYAKVI